MTTAQEIDDVLAEAEAAEDLRTARHRIGNARGMLRALSQEVGSTVDRMSATLDGMSVMQARE